MIRFVGSKRDLQPRDRRLPIEVDAQRGDQAHLVEQRGAQIDGDPANSREQLVDQGDRLHAGVVDRLQLRPLLAELQAQLERGQRLTELVVQLARKEPALLFLGRLELSVQLAKALVGDPDRARVGLDVANDEVDHRHQ